MGAYIYASGTYHPLEGNKVVSGGAMTAMKASDEIVVDGSRYQLGDNIPPSDVVSGLIISSGTSTYTSKLLKDTMIVSGGTVTMSGGKIQNIDVGSDGALHLSGVNTVTSARNLNVAGGNVSIESDSYVNNIGVDGTLVSNGASSKGYLKVYGQADNVTQFGGTVMVGGYGLSTGKVTDLFADSKCRIEVKSGGIVSSAYLTGKYKTFNNNENWFLYSSNVVISSGSSNYGSGAWMYIMGGGKCEHVRIAAKPNTTSTFYDSATSSWEPVFESTDTLGYLWAPTLIIQSSGIANSVTAYKRGQIIVDGGVASNVTVSSGGTCSVSAGGIVDSAVIADLLILNYERRARAAIFVKSGGIVRNVQVSSGGYLCVSSGGIAYNVASSSGANIQVDSGGAITYANN